MSEVEKEAGGMSREDLQSNEDLQSDTVAPQPSKPACPVCGGHLIEIRAKLVCSRCHAICETCCEGGRG